MRLIDADALAQKLENHAENTEYGSTILRIVASGLRHDKAFAPTIDAVPVVHGRWIHDINNLYGCSECTERETMSPKKLKPYCPNCSAKMDGE